METKQVERLHGTGVSDYYGSYMSIMHMTFVHGFLKFLFSCDSLDGFVAA